MLTCLGGQAGSGLEKLVYLAKLISALPSLRSSGWNVILKQYLSFPNSTSGLLWWPLSTLHFHSWGNGEPGWWSCDFSKGFPSRTGPLTRFSELHPFLFLLLCSSMFQLLLCLFSHPRDVVFDLQRCLILLTEISTPVVCVLKAITTIG